MRGRTFGDPAFHLVHPAFDLERVAAGEKTGQSGMGDRNVQAIAVIVGDVLPIDGARAKRNAALRYQLFESVRRDLVLARRHHVRDSRSSRLATDEDEAPPDFL